jgi:autotransporter-associated beta strand protein
MKRTLIRRRSKTKRQPRDAANSGPKALAGSISGFCRVLAVSALTALGLGETRAATFYWDPVHTGATNGGSGGTGEWLNSGSGFTPNPWWNGSADVDWNTGGTDAVFGNAAGSVFVNDFVSVNSLTFNSSFYNLGGSGGRIQFGSSAGLITVTNASHSATINTTLTGTNGFTKAGAGTLILTGDSTEGGTIAGLTGGITIAGGVLVLDAGTTPVPTVLNSSNTLSFTNTSEFQYKAAASGTLGATMKLSTLTFSSGEGTVHSIANSNLDDSLLTFSSLAPRVAGATGNFLQDSQPQVFNLTAGGAGTMLLLNNTQAGKIAIGDSVTGVNIVAPSVKSGTTIADSDTITVNTTGLAVGMSVSGTSIPGGRVIIAIGAGTVQLSDGTGVAGGTNSLTFAPAVSSIVDNGDGTSTVTLSNAMTGSASPQNITFALANKRIILTSQGAGFINQGIFFGGNSYAWYDTANSLPTVRALNYGVDSGTATQGASSAGLLAANSGKHVQVTGDVTGQTLFQINTLSLNGNGPANPFVNGFVINPGATLTITNGGILASGIGLPSAGLARGTISGGTILIPGSTELVIRVDQPSDRLVINSVISGTGGVTMSGLGSLLLSAQTTGALSFSGSATTIGSSTLQLASSTLVDPGALTVGMPVYGPGIPANTAIQSVSGSTVTLTNPATATSSFALSYPTTLNSALTTIQLTPAQAATLTVGQLVTGANIGPGTTIATNGINTATGVVTLTAAPIASAPLQTVTFGGSTVAFGDTQNYNLNAGAKNDDHITVTINSPDLQLTAAVPSLVAGMSVSGPGIAPGTTILSVAGQVVTLSQVATASTVDDQGRNVVVAYDQLQVGGGSTSVQLSGGQNAGVLKVGSLITGVNIPANTTIASLSGPGNKVVTFNTPIPALQTFPVPVAIGTGSSTIQVGVGQTANLFVNELITADVVGIPTGTTITAIDAATNTVTLSAPTTAPINPGATITFGKVLNQTLTFGGATLAFGASTIQLTAAQAATLVVGSTVTGPNVPPNTTITGIQDFGSYKIATLSNPVSGTVSVQYLSFGGADVVVINSSYSGGTRINSGTLAVGSAGIPAGFPVTVAGNAQFAALNSIIPNNVTLTGANAVLSAAGGNNGGFSGTITAGVNDFQLVARDFSTFLPANLLISGNITGTGTMEIPQISTGIVKLTGNNNNFTGPVIVRNSATLSVARLAALSYSVTNVYSAVVGGGAQTLTLNPAQANSLVIGATVTGTNIAPGTSVTAIDYNTGVVTLSAATLNSASNQSLTFSQVNGNPVTLTGTLMLALDGNRNAAPYNGGATAGNGTGAPQTLTLNTNITLLGNGVIQPASDGTAYGGYFPSASNKTIVLNRLTMTSNVLTVASLNGGGVQFTGPATMGGVGTINVTAATTSNRVAGLTFSGLFSGGGNSYAQDTLVINDNSVAVGGVPQGTVVFANAANTFGGNGSIIDIKGGVLSVATDGALGNSLNSILLNNATSATLQVTGSFTTGRQITIGQPSGNSIEVTAGNSLKLSAQFILPPSTEFYPLIKNDNGTLTLVANNTGTLAATGTTLGTNAWSGPLTINAGFVRVNNGLALGTSTTGVTVARTGAALQLANGVTVTSRLRLAGTGVSGAGSLQGSGAAATTASGQMILTADSTIGADAGSTLNLTGGITGISGRVLTLNSAGIGASIGNINITTKALDTAYTVIGDTGNNSTLITGVSDTSNILAGQSIRGPNIKPGTTVVSTTVDTIVLSQATNSNAASNQTFITQGSISLAKFGAGTATLGVDSPTFIGAVTVNQGNFVISGSGVTIGTPSAANTTLVQGPSGVLTVDDSQGTRTVHVGGERITGVTVNATNQIFVGAAQAAQMVTGQQVFGNNIPVNTAIGVIVVDANGDPNGFLTLNNNTTGSGAAQTVNFGSNRNLTLTGGTLIINGNATGTTEIFGTLTSNRGATNVIQTNPSGLAALTLNFPSLTLNGDSTMDFQGSGLGVNGTNKVNFYNASPGTTNLLLQRATVNSNSFASYNAIGGLTLTTNGTSTITVAAGQDLSFLSVGQAVTGGTIPASTTITNVDNSAHTITLSNTATSSTSFLTFGNANGIEALTVFNTTNAFPVATTSSADTYSFTNSSNSYFSNPQTINAFKITGGITVGDNGPRANSLTLSSGAILSPTGNNTVNFKVLSFGAQAFVAVGSGTTLTVSSLLTGGSGLVKALPGELQLLPPGNSAGYANLSAQTLTGNFNVDAGTVTLKAGQNNTLTPNQFLIVAPGATLNLNGTSQFALGTRGDGAALQGGAGTFTNTNASQAALILGADSGAFTFGGVITQGVGNGATSFFKGSSFNYNLSNASPYLGATVFAGGNNVLQDGGSIASTSSVDLNYARLTLNDNNVFASSVAMTGTTTAASATVLLSTTAGLSLGMTVNGVGVPANSVITAITGTSVTINGGNSTGVTAGTNALTFAFNRVNPSAPIAMRGASLAFTGRTQTAGTQTVGAVTLYEGANTIQAVNGGTGVNSAVLTLASLSRSAGSAATIQFPDNGTLGTMGNSANVVFSTLNGTNTVAAVAGNKNLLGPWAVVGREFASYIPTLGVGALNQTGFAGYSPNYLNLQPLATDNIRAILSIPGLTADTTVNTLAVNTLTANANAAITIDLGGKKLTLAGGGLILAASNTNAAITQNITIQNGTLTSGALNVGGDLYVHALNYGGVNNTFILSPTIANNGTGAVRLVKSSGAADAASDFLMIAGTSLSFTGLTGTVIVGAATTAGSNVVTVANPAGLSVGMSVTGFGLPTGEVVTAISGNSVTLSTANGVTTTATSNTYSGGTVINGGSMIVGPGGNIPAGGITISGGETTGVATLSQFAGGVIAPTNTVTVNGLGALSLTGNNNLAGLVFNGTGAGSTQTNVPPPPTVTTFNSLTPLGTGTLTLGGGGITSNPLNPAAIATVAGRLDFGTLASTVTVGAYNLPTNVSGFVFTDFAPTTAGLILQGVTGSGGGITKAGAGVLQFNVQSVFTGQLKVTAGTVQIGVTSGAANAGSRFSQLNLSSPTSRLNLNGNSTVLGSLAGNGIITNTLGSQTLTVGFDNSDSTFSGQISRFNDASPAAVTLVKIGTGTLTIASAQDANTGSSGGVTVNGGGLTYSNAGAAFPSTNIVGVTYTVNTGGTLTLDNNIGTNLDDRLGLAASNGTLALSGGTLAMIGNIAGSNEHINLLNFNPGASTIRLTGGANGATLITVAGAVSNQGGQDSGLVTGINLGGSGNGSVNVFVTGAFVGFGGGGGAGSETMTIRPDLLGDTTGGTGTGFLVRDPVTLNLRPLNQSSELTADMGQASLNLSNNSNVGLTASNNAVTNRIVASQTVNSLTLVNRVVAPNLIPDTGTPTLASGLGLAAGVFAATGTPLTLTSASGGFLALSTSAINIGAVTSGGVTADFHVVGGSTVLALNSSIVSSSAGIVKADDGTLVFNARQYYTGSAGTNGTTINGGTLQLGLGVGDNPIFVQPTGTIPTPLSLFLNGGALDLNGNSQIVERISNNNPNAGTGGLVINSAGSPVTLTSATVNAATFAGGIGTGLLTAPGNAINFTKSGNSTLTLTSLNTYTGSTVLRGGVLELKDSGTLAQTSDVTVNFGTLLFNESGLNPLGANPVRTPVGAALTLNGGTLSQTSGGSLDSFTVLNTVNVASGASTITQTVVQGTGSSAQINIGNLVQSSAGATVNIASANGVLGGGGLNNNQLLISNITPSAGSAGSPATLLRNGMLPAWITVNNGADFAGYLTSPAAGSLGVGAIGSTNYPGYAAPLVPFSTTAMPASQIPANANSSFNLSVNASALPVAGRLVNSLAVRNPAANTTTIVPLNFPTDTLSLGTGGLLLNSNNTSAPVFVQGGRITAGSQPNAAGVLYVTATGGNTQTINSQIVNNGNQIYSANTDGASNIVIVSSTAGLVAGQPVSGPGIPASSSIVSILDGTSFTIGSNTTALSFLAADIKKVNSTTSAGSPTVTVLSGGTALAVGMYVSGPAIPAGTVVTALGSTANPNAVTLSNAPTRTMVQQAYFTTVGNSFTGLTLPTAAQTDALTVGMAVTGTNIAANTVISGINSSFSTDLAGNTTANSNTITGVNTAGLLIGMAVTAPGIPANEFITGINTGLGQVTITTGNGVQAGPKTVNYTGHVVSLSAPTTGTASTQQVSFGATLNFARLGTNVVMISNTTASTTGTAVNTSTGSPLGVVTSVLVNNVTGLAAGMPVTGPGIPAGTVIGGFGAVTIGAGSVATFNTVPNSTQVQLLAPPANNFSIQGASALNLVFGTGISIGDGTSGAVSLVKTGSGTLTLTPQIVLNGSLNQGFTVILPVNAAAAGLIAGMTVSGTGIPADTLIQSTNGNTIVLDHAATLTSTSLALSQLSFGPGNVVVPNIATSAFSNTYTGGTIVNQGTLSLAGFAGATVIPGDITINNATVSTFTPSFTAATVTANTALITLPSVAGLSIGMTVIGNGIPAGEKIAAINVATNQILLTSNTNVTAGTNVALTFGTAGQIINTSNVTINGAGTLSLFGANTLRNITLNNTGGNAAPTVALGTGGTLTLSNGLNVVNDSLSFTPTVSGTNSVLVLANNTITTSGASPDSLLVTVPVSPAGTLVKAGPGSLILTPTIGLTTTTTANTATFTVLNTGGLSVGMLVSGTGIPAGRSIASISGYTITLNSGIGVTAASNTALTFSGNTFSGGVNLSAGSLILTQNTNQFAVNAPTITASNATINIPTTGLAVGMAVTGTGIPAGEYIVSINPGVSITLSSATGITTQANSTLSFTGANTVLAGPAGSGPLNMSNNTAILSDGTLRVIGNAVNIAANATFGPLPGSGTAVAGNGLTLTGPVTLVNGGPHTITVPDLQNTTTISGQLIGAKVTLTKAGTGTLVLSNPNNAGNPATPTIPGTLVGTSLTFGGTVTTGATTFAGSTVVTVANPAGILVGQSVVGTGIPGGVTVASISGNNVTLLNGAAVSTEITSVNVTGGVLKLGAATAVPAGMQLSVSPGAAYDIAGFGNQIVSSLSGGGMVTSSTGTPTLFVGGTSTTDVTTNVNAIFDGLLTAPNTGTFVAPTYPGLAVTKVGLGTQTLTGASLYSGATNIFAGKLIVNGSLANTNVIVGGTNAASLGGTGTIGNGLAVTNNVNVTVNGTGTIDLTNGSLGGLTINPPNGATGLSLGNGAKLMFDIGSASTDQINIINGGKILVNNTGTTTVSFNQLAGTPLQNGIYYLINFNALAAGSGTTSNFALGSGAQLGWQLNLNSSALTLNVGGVTQFFFWKGSAGNNWSTLAPTTNWATDAGGATLTTDLPNATSDVTFSASGATNLSTQLGADFTINTLTFAAAASDVTISGGNTLTLNNNLTMNVGAPNATISTAGLTLGGPQTWTINTTIASPNQKNLTVSAPLTGTSGLTISAPSPATGRVILSGNNSNFTGGITVVGNGTNVALQLGSATALGPVAGPNPLVVSSGALDMFGQSATISSLSSTLATAGTGIIKNTVASTTSTLNVVQGSTVTTIFSGAIQDTGTGGTAAKVALVVDGGGTLSLTSPVAGNLTTFSGGTTINNGTLRLGANGNQPVATNATNGPLGIGPVTINSTVNGAGTLNLSPGNVATTFFIQNAITLNGGEIKSTGGNQRLANDGVSVLRTINVGILGGTITPSPTASQDVYVDGQLIGSGGLSGLTVGGPGSGKVILTNNTNTYSGTLTSTGSGNLQLASTTNTSTALGAADLFLSSNANGLTFGSTVTAATVGSLAGSGNFGLQNSNATPAAVILTVGNNGHSSNYTGTISNSGTLQGGLTKVGAGTFTLGNGSSSYPANTYRGATTVNAGAFLVNSANATGSVTGLGNVFVNGTATLGGNGVIQGGDNNPLATGVITFAGGTFLDPGFTAAPFGTLRFGVQSGAAQTATLTLQGNSTYRADVGTGNGSSDRVFVIGNAVITGAKLALNAVSTPDQGRYTLLNTTTGVTGTFTGGITNTPANYSVVYTPLTVDLQRFATIGSVTTTTSLAVIRGATVPFSITVENSAPAGSADLSFYATSIPAQNTIGAVATAGSPIVVQAGTSSPPSAGLSFNSAGIATAGPGKSGSFTINSTGANVTNPSLVAGVLVDVYDHATYGAFAGGTLSMQPVRVGYVGPVNSTNSLAVTNGSPGDYRVNLGGSLTAPPSGNISLNDLHGVAPGTIGNITASLATGQPAGTFSQAFTYSLGDDSTIAGSNNGALGTVPITVTGNVYTGQGIWGATGGGPWGTFNNWTMPGGYPGLDGAASINDTATFNSSLGVGTVTLGPTTSPELNAITFAGTSGTIAQSAGSGSVTLRTNQNNVAPVVTVTGTGSTPTISAPVILTNTATLNTASSTGAANTLTLSGPISGPGGLTKTGPGTAFLTNTNTYAGKTAVNGGTLSVAGGASLGQDPGGLGVTDQISVDNGGKLAFTGDATLSSTQGFAVGSFNGTVDVATNQTVIVKSAITGTLSGTATTTGTLTKTGAGTLNIRNNIQADIPLAAPGFVLNAGTLSLVTGPWADPAGASPRATSDLSAGNLVFNGGTLAINIQGASGPGTVSGNDHLTAANGSDATASQVPSIQINATTKLTIDLGFYAPPLGSSYTFLSDATRLPTEYYTSYFQVNGITAIPTSPGSHESTIVNTGGYSFMIDYNGGPGGNDIVLLTVVPEPGTATLLLGGVGLLALMRRRRPRNLPFGL